MSLVKKYIKLLSLALLIAITTAACEKDDPMVDESLFPVVSFTATATSIEAGTSITFTDNSTNAPTLWTWNFEGGNPTYSNKPSPTVLYEGAGIYDVTLTARNEFGADEILFENHIEVTAPPVIDIDIEPQVRLNFDDNLSNDGLVDIDATSVGSASYGIRPGGGGAYIFTGTNNLNIEGYTGINGAGPRSVALWLKTTHASTSGLVHWGASGSFSRSSFKLQNTGVVRFEYQGGGHNTIPIINDDKWHHVAYTYDGDTIRIYIDGVEDFNVSGKVLKTGASGETDVNIGSQLGASIYEGAMDDVRIFTEVLTPEEVLILSMIK